MRNNSQFKEMGVILFICSNSKCLRAPMTLRVMLVSQSVSDGKGGVTYRKAELLKNKNFPVSVILV